VKTVPLRHGQASPSRDGPLPRRHGGEGLPEATSGP